MKVAGVVMVVGMVAGGAGAATLSLPLGPSVDLRAVPKVGPRDPAAAIPLSPDIGLDHGQSLPTPRAAERGPLPRGLDLDLFDPAVPGFGRAPVAKP